MSTQSKLCSSVAPTMYIWEVLIFLNLLQHLWFSLGPCQVSSHSFLKSLPCVSTLKFSAKAKCPKLIKTYAVYWQILHTGMFSFPACQRTPLEWSFIAYHACHVYLIVFPALYGAPWCRRSTVFLCPQPSRDVFTFHCPFLHQWQQWQGRI